MLPKDNTLVICIVIASIFFFVLAKIEEDYENELNTKKQEIYVCSCCLLFGFLVLYAIPTLATKVL